MWKPVVGYESLYEVSDKGNVRSKHSYGRGKKGGLLKPWRSPQGYSMATLSRDGATFVATTSRLVLAAFVGPHPPDKPYACHKNGNTKDNRLANLYWGLTPTTNAIETYTGHPTKDRLMVMPYFRSRMLFP